SAWQINYLNGQSFTNSKTLSRQKYSFAGFKTSTSSTDFMNQSRESNRSSYSGTTAGALQTFNSELWQTGSFKVAADAWHSLSPETRARIGGGLQLGAGLVQAGFSIAAGIASCPVTLGAGCAAGIAGAFIGVDNAIAGFETLRTGETAETLLHMGVSAAASQFMSRQNAQRLATGVELVAGFGAGISDDLVRATEKFTRAGNSVAQASRLGMQHASVAARYQLGGMAGGALVGYGTTGSIDGALMGASFGQMGGSIAAHFAVACFTAGTPLVVDMEGNSRPIDEIEVGDFVLARSEFDPDGPLELKRVEEKFVRTSVVMELVVHGQSIKTTAEHPFYVPAQGKFVAAGELQVGEQLVGHDGKLVEIESIGSTGEVTTVYNLRVADFHTYFVGGGLWGFDVWVHNAAYKLATTDGKSTLTIHNKFDVASNESTQLQRFVREWNVFLQNNGGSLTRRQLTDAEEKLSKAWKSRMRRDQPSRFTSDKAVGHVPDASAGGPAVPANDKAMALFHSVNGYVGGILSHIPVGTIYHSVKLTRKTFE
ncbi:MAG: polymorphic toxin-type HINT domain-containing protein, partial [Burkholderiaceae bacterium]